MIFRSLSALPRNFGPTSVTIGNFDGVHAGHRHLIARVVALAREHDWRPSVLTFDPHPARLVAPERAPRLLNSLERRCELLEQAGIEQILVLPFTPEVAGMSPEDFVREILVDAMQARAVVVGENFRFGHRAAGNTSLLRELGARYGFMVDAEGAVLSRHRIVSSSEIRRLIQAGQVSAACRLLARPFDLEGEVIRGHGVGSKQTVPTLNLATSAELLPAGGVYVTRTLDRNVEREWNSITNIGYRPTFNGDSLSIETYLLSPIEGESPTRIRVEFLLRLREERKFENAAALKTQIMKDVARTVAYFRRRKRVALSMPGNDNPAS